MQRLSADAWKLIQPIQTNPDYWFDATWSYTLPIDLEFQRGITELTIIQLIWANSDL